MSRVGPTLLAIGFLLLAGPSAAQTAGETLYREGIEAYGRGEYETACRRFSDSYDTESKAAPLFMLGKCELKRGRLATALGSFQRVLTQQGGDDATLGHAKEEIDALTPRVPRLAVVADPAAPADTSAELDGKTVPIGGPSLPIDPGPHKLVVRAAHHAAHASDLTAIEGQTLTIKGTPGEVERPTSPLVAPTTAPPPPAAPADQPRSSGTRTIGVVVGGIGLAALAAAAVTGILILGHKSTFDDKTSTTAERIDAKDAGEGLIPLNYVAWGVGIAGVGVGTTLFLLGGGAGSAKSSRWAASGPNPLHCVKSSAGRSVQLDGVGPTLRGRF